MSGVQDSGMARILASEKDLLKQAAAAVLRRNIGRFSVVTAQNACFSGRYVLASALDHGSTRGDLASFGSLFR
jgi:uncharacterized protein (DUF1778 family)